MSRVLAVNGRAGRARRGAAAPRAAPGAAGPRVVPPAPARERRDDFLEMLAHDVRNHLIAVERNLEFLQGGGGGLPTAPQKEILAASQDAVGLVLGLAGDILDLARYESGEVRLVRSFFNLVELAAESLRLCRAAGADRGVRFVFSPGCASARVCADRARLGRVFHNLLLNAANHSPARGRVQVGCARDGARQVLVTVEDAGFGIPPRKRGRVFERPDRRDLGPISPRGGLGLGLYFCRQTIEAHGGRIWVDPSIPGDPRGTRFCFTLPCAGLPGES